MADYAEWGEAVGRGLGWGQEAFLATYKENRKAATADILEDSPLTHIILGLAKVGLDWTGPPTRIYQAIMEQAPHCLGPRWPTTVSKFSSELLRIAPQLRLHGIFVESERKSAGRILTIRTDDSWPTPRTAKKPRP